MHDSLSSDSSLLSSFKSICFLQKTQMNTIGVLSRCGHRISYTSSPAVNSHCSGFPSVPKLKWRTWIIGRKGESCQGSCLSSFPVTMAHQCSYLISWNGCPNAYTVLCSILYSKFLITPDYWAHRWDMIMFYIIYIVLEPWRSSRLVQPICDLTATLDWEWIALTRHLSRGLPVSGPGGSGEVRRNVC